MMKDDELIVILRTKAQGLAFSLRWLILEVLRRFETKLREQEQSKWISVKERVPEDNKEVLIYCGSYHEIGWYDSDNKSWRSDFLGCCTDDVTHWMPMPEPPKGE